jgi:hypothetical protein
MNAVELFKRGEQEPVAYACGRCGRAWAAQHKGAAEDCCTCRGKGCTNLPEKYTTRCRPCAERESAEAKAAMLDREREAFEKAAKVSWREWDAERAVYFDGGRRYGADGYFDSLRHLHDSFDSPDQVPAYCWATRPMGPPKLHAEDIVEEALEEYYEGARDSVDVAGLQVLLDAWSKDNDPGGYMVDRRTAILLDGYAESLRPAEDD